VDIKFILVPVKGLTLSNLFLYTITTCCKVEKKRDHKRKEYK